jgi:hypothetical protein
MKWKKKHLIKFQAVTIKKFHSQAVCDKLCVLTVFRSSTLVHLHAEKQWLWRTLWLSHRRNRISWGKRDRYILLHMWYCVSSNYLLFFSNTFFAVIWDNRGTQSRNGWGTALQTGSSRDRFPGVTMEFFIDIILPVVLWPWGWLSL